MNWLRNALCDVAAKSVMGIRRRGRLLRSAGGVEVCEARILPSGWAPIASNPGFSTVHDSQLTDQVSAYDEESDPLTYSIVSGPSDGSVTMNSDGTFTWTPPELWVGSTSFVYEVSDGTSTGEGTVTLDAWNGYTTAVNDDLPIELTEEPEPIPLYVLGNDVDENGDPLTIQSVTSSQAGATIWIDESGQFLWYLPPDFTTERDIGGEEPDGDPQELTGEWLEGDPAETYSDTFQYSISDTVGAVASASVTVVAEGEPGIAVVQHPDYQTPASNRIEGDPGYKAYVRIKVGAGAAGYEFAERDQFWMTNDTNVVDYYGVDGGTYKHVTNSHKYFLDKVDLGGDAAVVLLKDKLQQDLSANTYFVVRTANKFAGYNAKSGNQYYYVPGADGDMPINWTAWNFYTANLRGSVSYIYSYYVYVNKEKLEQAKAAGTIPLADYNAVVASCADLGIPYANLTSHYEKLIVNSDEYVSSL